MPSTNAHATAALFLGSAATSLAIPYGGPSDSLIAQLAALPR